MVTPEVGQIIRDIAFAEDRSVSFIIRKLIEESPRIKAVKKDKRKPRRANA